MKSCTHRIAVNAYLIKENKFLLLKRTDPPYLWGPPGGRLDIDENPISGLQREVWEETGLSIEVIAPVNTWFGNWKGTGNLLAINYLAKYRSGEVTLSSEHNAFHWVSLEELISGDPISLHSPLGFQISDFQLAHRIGKCLGIIK
ncbi:MAG: NUDIX hydrolase [Calditrichaeota bacterium]|nr:MAG: NUDIX hydrolase [Calditrichota bacterium]